MNEKKHIFAADFEQNIYAYSVCIMKVYKVCNYAFIIVKGK